MVTGDVDPRRAYTLLAMPIRKDGLNQDMEDNDDRQRASPIEDGAVIDASFFQQDVDWYVIENTTGTDQVLKALAWGGGRAEVEIIAPNGGGLSHYEVGKSYAYALAPPGFTYISARGRATNYQLRAWFDNPAPLYEARAAAQLGLNSLLPSAIAWQNHNNCFGCHVQSMALMGGALGLDNGYVVREEELNELVEFMRKAQEQAYSYGGFGPLTSMLFNGMALAYYQDLVAPGNAQDLEILGSTAEVVKEKQRSDGRVTHSKIEVPVQQGDFQTTADAVQIAQHAPGGWTDVIERGGAFLAEAEPETTQDHVYRIIGLVRVGTPVYEKVIYDEVEALRGMQNRDGGWSELPGLGSSPYATGQVLYGLKLAGVSVMDAAFQAGALWLIEVQDWSGHWPPLGSSSRNPSRVTSFPPTMWATIGLAGSFETLNVGITSPPPGRPAEGEVMIAAKAEAKGVAPITRVEFYVDDVLLCLDEDAPYECPWAAPAPAVPHKIKAVAYSTAGRTGESVLLTAPAEGDGRLQVVLAPDAERPVPPNIEIVLDCSGSMWARIEGKARIEIAREVLETLFNELPDEVNVALRAYGHQYHFEAGVCTDTELLVPLGPLDRVALMKKINALNPQGKTLIGYSLQQVPSDLAKAQGQSIVVLVSDGEEVCGADPCEVADDLAASGLDLQTHVVGYAIDDPAIDDQLKCVAEVTGGSYLPAGSAEQLVAALRAAVTVDYVVQDMEGIEVARGVVGGEPIVLPAGTYRVEVMARTPLVAEATRVRGDQTTVLSIEASGTLQGEESAS